jgi:hypothetical protein
VVFRPARLSPAALEAGYRRAYASFYRWTAIAAASFTHGTLKHQIKHFAYAAGWKKFERCWNVVIRARQLRTMTPVLEAVLSKVSRTDGSSLRTVIDAPRSGTRRDERWCRNSGDPILP